MQRRFSAFLTAALVACFLGAVLFSAGANAQLPAYLGCDVFTTAVTYCTGGYINVMQHYSSWCSSCCLYQPQAETGWASSPFTVRTGFFMPDVSNYAIQTGVQDWNRLNSAFAGAGALNIQYAASSGGVVGWPEPANSVQGYVTQVWDQWYRNIAGLQTDGWNVNLWGFRPWYITAYGLTNPLPANSVGYFGDTSSVYWNSPLSLKWSKKPTWSDGSWGISDCIGTYCWKREYTEEEEAEFDEPMNTVEVTADLEEASLYAETEGSMEHEARYAMANCKTWWNNRGKDSNCMASVLSYYSRNQLSLPTSAPGAYRITNQFNTPSGLTAITVTPINVGAVTATLMPSGPNSPTAVASPYNPALPPNPVCFRPAVPNYAGEMIGSANSFFNIGAIDQPLPQASTPYSLDVCMDNTAFCHCCYATLSTSQFPAFDWVLGPGGYVDTSSSFDSGGQFS